MNPRELLDRLLSVSLSDIFKSQEEFDLTEGSIGWPLFYLSLPIVVTNLLQTAYNLADTFWLGQYSTEALAAISFAFPMVFLLISLGMGLSVAGSVLVAQYTGAGETENAEYAASQTVTFALLGSLLLGGVGYFLVDDFLAFLGADPSILPLAASYMQVVSLGLMFMFGFFVFISLMRGYGDTITPMLVMLGTVVLNIVLDPFLIFGWGPFPELGIEGAAFATVFSRGLAMLVGLAIMLGSTRGISINVPDLRPDLTYLRKLLRIGLPASVEGTGRALSVNLLLFIVAGFPNAVIAAFGVGIRVFSVIFLPAIAVGRGVETLSGQNIGAGNEDRASRTNNFAAVAMFAVLSAAAVVIWFTAADIIAVFTDDPAVIPVGAAFLKTVAPTFGFTGVMRAYSGGFRGAGKTLTAAAIAIFTQAVVRLPLAWVGAERFGTDGLFAAFVVSNIVGGIIAFLWFRRGTWRETDLTDGPRGGVSETVVEDDPAVDD
ncbi:MATE family efflux transporter [Salinibaculum rarum]|uniref:MATE family efflux transporter n=1 Tax=Salinibaculum rarum TaxID=3058903 RepID=UPI00265EBA02|nr:MATE family efflux transporter [Salinibaculum sp. KK48]